jgi:hypothetical protein
VWLTNVRRLADPATLERIHQRTNTIVSISEAEEDMCTIEE